MEKHNIIRVASAVPEVIVAEPLENIKKIEGLIEEAIKNEVDIIVFPELCITGYTCGDLFHNSRLIELSEEALFGLQKFLMGKLITVIVGAPSRDMINTAYVINNGKIIGAVGKKNLPNYKEFYEKRWFKEDTKEPEIFEITLTNNSIHTSRKVKFGIEICEDLWSPVPPSTSLVQRGAEIIFNLSASNELVGKENYLESLILQQSARLICGYVYASSGPGESTQDLVYLGKSIIAENGRMLRKTFGEGLRISDIDLDIIRHDRNTNTSFRSFYNPEYPTNSFEVETITKKEDILFRDYPAKMLYKRGNNLRTIMEIQITALIKRLRHTKMNPVIGISGGSDSTWALIICHEAIRRLGPEYKIIGVTMPGFATSERTLNNSIALMKAYGIEVKVIDIKDICRAELKALGHDEETQDITYENVQARTRTQILMNLANKEGGLVIGTGDLSELALGWCTYNADHMSMYGINVSVPKSLIKTLISSYAESTPDNNERKILLDILDTPVSPELTGSGAEGDQAQVTEDKIGPYVIHDFFLYYFLRYGFSPEKLLWIAKYSDLMESYTIEEVEKWLKVFIKRFFTQQFKRSCLPDGPKIGSINLSPRGDLRMPSDASYKDWL